MKIGRILIALRPDLDVPSGPIGGHPGHLRQQLGVTVDGLGAGHPGGASQRLGVLDGDCPRGERVGDVGHLSQRFRPTLPAPCLPLRRTRVAAQHLYRIDPAIVQPLHGSHNPCLCRIGPRTNTPQRRHQPAKHAPPSTRQRQRP